MSLALALDKLGNELLFALSRRVQDRIVIAARKARFDGWPANCAPGDPGLPLRSAERRACVSPAPAPIGVSVTPGQVLHPLKSMSMVLGIGIDLPPARWSRCDDCPSAPQCTDVGPRRGSGHALSNAP